MNFGKIFRYNCKFTGGDVRVWRVFAESREQADIKLNDYICHCGSTGLPVPTHIEFSTEQSEMILG